MTLWARHERLIYVEFRSYVYSGVPFSSGNPRSSKLFLANKEISLSGYLLRWFCIFSWLAKLVFDFDANQKQPPEVFYKKDLSLQLYQKRYSGIGVFLWIFSKIFKSIIFMQHSRATPSASFTNVNFLSILQNLYFICDLKGTLMQIWKSPYTF